MDISNIRPGAVCTANGDIRLPDVHGEMRLLSSGSIFVTPEQASDAKAFGWLLSGETLADWVLIERQA